MKRKIGVRTMCIASAPGALLALAWGCNAVVDSGGYHVVQPDGSMGDVDSAGIDAPGRDAPGGDAGDGCVVGTNRQTLENQCNASQCQTIPAAVPLCDGGVLCPPSPPDAGTSSGTDSGPVDSGLPSCASVATGPVVITTGSTALQTYVFEVAKSLATSATPITIVYQGSGSCIGAEAILGPSSTYPLANSAGKIYYYDSSGTQHVNACDMTGLEADIGFSDVFATSCSAYAGIPGLPNNVLDNYGPVQVMNFIVPVTSPASSISIQQAAYVFGSGGTVNGTAIGSWTNPSQYFVRSGSSGTQSMISAALGLNPTQWWGVNAGSTGNVIADVTAANNSGDAGAIAQTIGIAASDAVDPNRLGTAGPPTVKILALQDYNAGCAFYPDSTSNAYDKRNVRDGLYPIWGPSHLFTKTNPSAAAQTVVSIFQGLQTLAGVPLIANYATNHVIPLCAMHVQRSNDGQDYTPFTPTARCDCYYESNVSGGAPSCKTCSQQQDCPANTVCNKWDGQSSGFCEQM